MTARRTILILTLFWLTAGSSFGQVKFKPPREPDYDHFVMGVYIASHENVLDVPMSKVFSDFAARGVEIAWVNQFNYYPLAKKKKLNQYAKANGLQLLVQMFHRPEEDYKLTDEELSRKIRSQVDQLNAMPDSDVVVGWGIGDEIENHYLKGEHRQQRRERGEKQHQRFSRLLRQIDQERRVTINHDGADWIAGHEDEPYCSTQWTGRFNNYRVRERIAEAQRLGYENYFLVSQAASCSRGEANLRWYGFRKPVNDAVLDSRTVAEEVQDYAETAYLEGSTGCMYFLYWAGGANYQGYTLTDIRGDDYQGKWDAVLKAMKNIRKWEGAPLCEIRRPARNSWVTGSFEVSVEAEAPEGDPVSVVRADYSTDGCLTWKHLPDAKTAPYRFVLDLDDVDAAGAKPISCWIRARAVNKRGPSLWDVIEVKIRRK